MIRIYIYTNNNWQTNNANNNRQLLKRLLKILLIWEPKRVNMRTIQIPTAPAIQIPTAPAFLRTGCNTTPEFRYILRIFINNLYLQHFNVVPAKYLKEAISIYLFIWFLMSTPLSCGKGHGWQYIRAVGQDFKTRPRHGKN